MLGDCNCDAPRVMNKLDECCSSRQDQGNNPCIRGNQRDQQYEERNPCIGDYEKHLYEPLTEDNSCDVKPRKPYQVPGYAGHVPSLQSRYGGTYGHDTHEYLTCDECKPKQTRSLLRNSSHICPTTLHEPRRIPGYTGHVPGLKHMVGGIYGDDTHKLLYSDVVPYPSREENLSPPRQNQNVSYNYGKAGAEPSSGRRDGLDHPGGGLSGTYKKPDEFYYKPMYKYRIADTYATRADVTLVDPCVNEESKVVISTRELDDTQVVRTRDTLEERVQDFPFIYKPVRHRPTIPGFDTYVDAMRGARGQRFEFNDHTPAHKQLQQQLVLERGNVRNPLERNGINKTQQQQSYNQPHTEDAVYGYGKYGDKQKYTNSSICDFTSNYRRRQSTEWAPATISRPDPPMFDTPGEIYTQHMGLLPGYTAHIPGAMFRCGKTFTDDSRDARKALRGDRF